MVKQVRLLWTAASGAGGVSVLHFADTSDVTAIAGCINGFGNGLETSLANTTQMTADPLVRILNTASGVLTGEETLTGVETFTGTAGASAVPNAAQVLLRCATGDIVAGRRLKGRIFIPGVAAAGQAADGTLGAGTAGLIQTAANALDFEGHYGIWHRPVAGAGGVFSSVNTITVWNEFAVQRRRRQ